MKKEIAKFFCKRYQLFAAVFLFGVVFANAQSVAQYHPAGQWPGHLRGEFYDMKLQGDYLYASMVEENVLAVLPAGGVDLKVASRRIWVGPILTGYISRAILSTSDRMTAFNW